MKKKRSFSAALRSSVLLGLVTLAPLIVTGWVLGSVVGALDHAIYHLLPATIHIPGLGIVVTLALLIATGMLARTVTGRYFARFWDSLLRRVPVIRGLYSLAKRMSTVFFSEDPAASFKRVVSVPFGGASSRAIGFYSAAFSRDESLVFMPTAPNPTSGYVLIFKNRDIVDLDLTVEGALQLILSCGAGGLKDESGHAAEE